MTSARNIKSIARPSGSIGYYRGITTHRNYHSSELPLIGITNFRNYHSLNVGNSNVGNSEGYYLGITTDRNYQLLELPIRLVGIPNWLEALI